MLKLEYITSSTKDLMWVENTAIVYDKYNPDHLLAARLLKEHSAGKVTEVDDNEISGDSFNRLMMLKAPDEGMLHRLHYASPSADMYIILAKEASAHYSDITKDRFFNKTLLYSESSASEGVSVIYRSTYKTKEYKETLNILNQAMGFSEITNRELLYPCFLELVSFLMPEYELLNIDRIYPFNTYAATPPASKLYKTYYKWVNRNKNFFEVRRKYWLVDFLIGRSYIYTDAKEREIKVAYAGVLEKGLCLPDVKICNVGSEGALVRHYRAHKTKYTVEKYGNVCRFESLNR